jgi:tetratricopeptide (TPR) repeat protein
MELAESHRSAGDIRKASAALEQAEARLVDLGRDRTATAGTLYNNWALSLTGLGQQLDAERIFQRAIELSRADATDDTVSPMLLVNYARNLRDLGRLDEAAAYAERGYAKARGADYEIVINQSLLLRASIYRQQAALARAADMLGEVEPRLHAALPPGHIAFAALASEQALLAQAQGDLHAALDMSNRALAIARASMKAGGQGPDYLPGLLIGRSGIQTDLNRFDAAESDAKAAVKLLQIETPAGVRSTTLGRAYLALGRALEKQSDRDGARSALRSAVEHLENAAGREHPDAVSARELLGRLDKPT